MATERKFEVVSETPDESQSCAEQIGTQTLILGLKALSQRAIAAIADLFMLATIMSAFWLWYLTPKPDTYQIVSLSIYGAFVLAANWIVRRR
jgi:hypothetical protein